MNHKVFSIIKVIFMGTLMVLAGAISVSAGSIPDSTELNGLIKDYRKATADAAKNIPGSRIKKTAEDKLDQAERLVDDRQAIVDRLNDNDDATDAQKTAAKKRLKAAEDARNEAKELAKTIKSRFPDKDEAYRDALKRRREIRKKLKDADYKLGKVLRGVSRNTPLKNDRQKVQRALREGKKYPKFALLGTSPLGDLTQSGLLQCSTLGKGNTIGAIVELQLTNKGDEALQVAIPAMVLVSQSGKSQNYVAPFSQVVEVPAGETVAVSIEGMCINRSRPPVADGAEEEMIMQDIHGTVLTSTMDVSNEDQKDKAEELEDAKAELEKKLAEARKLKAATETEIRDIVDEAFEADRDLAERVTDKYAELEDAIRSRISLGADERDEAHKKDTGGKAELQESLEREAKDIAKLNDDFNRWYELEVETSLRSRPDDEDFEEYISLKQEYKSAVDRVNDLESEVSRIDGELKKMRDPNNQELDAIQTSTIITGAEAIVAAVDELQNEGALEEMPFADPEKKRETALQWGTWASEEIAEATGEEPATKENITKVIEDQVGQDTELTPEVKEQLKPGIDSIWEVVELTGTKAKALEEKDEI